MNARGVLLSLGALLGLGAIMSRPSKASPAQPSASGGGGGGWADARAPYRIAEYVDRYERAYGPWPGLADFLIATAHRESRGNSQVAGDSGKSIGWFQIQRRTASGADGVMPSEDDLRDEGLAVAYAIDLVCRLSRWSHAEPIRWRDVRRGWRMPALVSDQHELKALSHSVSRRFLETLRALGMPVEFADRRVDASAHCRPFAEIRRAVARK